MYQMKTIYIYIFLFVFVPVTFAQTTTTIVAEQGDGIFSILRKQGLDPVKYYGEFLTLNKAKLKNGSELVLGQAYQIPVAPDSFKKMAVVVEDNTTEAASLFDKELGSISPKSDRLKNAVIYLLLASPSFEVKDNIKRLRNEMLVSLAEELMVHGAKVLVLKGDGDLALTELSNEKEEANVEAPMANLEEMRQYVDVVNTEYLKNYGKYQRLLVINFNESVVDSKYYRVSVFHDNNPEGERFAKNIQLTMNKYSVQNNAKDYTEVFSQKNNLFLAKNAMPPITLIDIGDTKDPSIEGRISVKPDKVWLTNIITTGIFSDYANLEINE